MDSDVESLRALVRTAEENTNLIQKLYNHVRQDPRTKSWPNFKAIDAETLDDEQETDPDSGHG
jgi:uncharacterized protein YbaP (TraB family)